MRRKNKKAKIPSKPGSPDAGVIFTALLHWFRSNARDLPWRRTTDPYAIWISEIMLQQTQVKTVIPYWERWMAAFPNVQALADADQDRVLKLWEGLGYYTRARNLQKAAAIITTEHDGVFPTDFQQILALPGIGRYTAGAIGSIAFNQSTPILDGNVIRVLTRFYGISQNPREQSVNERLWALAQELVSCAAEAQKVGDRNCSALNQSLMELGATVCTPRQAACPSCPLVGFCAAHAKGWVDRLPNLEKRKEPTRRQFSAFVVEWNGRVLVRQRPAGVVNAHLWEFPNVEITDNQSVANEELVRLTGKSNHSSQFLCQINHSITRYRITLEATLVTLSEKPGTETTAGRWLHREELEKLAFTSAHRKILNKWMAAK